jgi:hypothetical protein
MKQSSPNPNSAPQNKGSRQEDALSEQELDKVTGGTGKAGTGKTAADEGPKETITFEYGGMQITY